MNQDDLKRAVAQAAIDYVPNDCIVGVGTGSTANFFIDELAKIKHKIRGAVASSEASTKRLQGHGIEVLSLNDAGEPAGVCGRCGRDHQPSAHDQGRRRRADAREDRGGGQQEIHLRMRCQQAGGRAGQVPAAGRSDPDGAQLGCAPTGRAGRAAEVARGFHHR